MLLSSTSLLLSLPSCVHFLHFMNLHHSQGGRPRVADFVHGSDGLGNTFLSPPKSKKIEKTASEFLVDKVSEYPGEVSILALGPLTNLALVTTGFLCQF